MENNMIKTRCKFVVKNVSKDDKDGVVRWVDMEPVMYDENGDYNVPEENKKFWEYTPCGNLQLSVTNDSLKGIEIGEEYYIDITKA